MTHTLAGSLTIDHRFRGPPQSGNGGYVCGRMAAYVEGNARVRLLRPPPLQRPLQVFTGPQGAELRDGEHIVAKAWPDETVATLLPPASPGWQAATAMAGRYLDSRRHAFPGCFVCGPEREAGDGLNVFPGPSADGSRVASPWVPGADLADEHGQVHPWFVWAALDCPSGWAVLHRIQSAAVLGEYSVRRDAPLFAGQDYVVSGWPLSSSGRKHQTASALHGRDGALLACALATWFEVDPASLSPDS